MNFGLILAGGTGQRMRTSGMPKQFLPVYGKPIIIYTIEKFASCKEIDSIVISCNPLYIDYMEEILVKYPLPRKINVVAGGKDRQKSVQNGVDFIYKNGGAENDIVVIHDGVRPLVEKNIISENIRVAQTEGCAMTVKPVIESVIITNEDKASFDDFKKRDETYSLTSPQTFKLSTLVKAYEDVKGVDAPILC